MRPVVRAKNPAVGKSITDKDDLSFSHLLPLISQQIIAASFADVGKMKIIVHPVREIPVFRKDEVIPKIDPDQRMVQKRFQQHFITLKRNTAVTF